MAAFLFDLPDLDFTMSFGDNQCCDRCGYFSCLRSGAARHTGFDAALQLDLVGHLFAGHGFKNLHAPT